jgi:hypothetical protein
MEEVRGCGVRRRGGASYTCVREGSAGGHGRARCTLLAEPPARCRCRSRGGAAICLACRERREATRRHGGSALSQKVQKRRGEARRGGCAARLCRRGASQAHAGSMPLCPPSGVFTLPCMWRSLVRGRPSSRCGERSRLPAGMAWQGIAAALAKCCSTAPRQPRSLRRKFARERGGSGEGARLWLVQCRWRPTPSHPSIRRPRSISARQRARLPMCMCCQRVMRRAHKAPTSFRGGAATGVSSVQRPSLPLHRCTRSLPRPAARQARPAGVCAVQQRHFPAHPLQPSPAAGDPSSQALSMRLVPSCASACALHRSCSPDGRTCRGLC